MTTWFGRRFLYLVVDNYLHTPSPWYTLHRIDPSPLFHYSQASPAPVKAVRLPEPAMSFHLTSGSMGFTLLGRSKDKIAAVDHMGRGVLYYDDGSSAVHPLPGFTPPRCRPVVSVAVDDLHSDSEDEGSAYVLETFPGVDCTGRRSVEALVYDGRLEDWVRRSLPPPPYVHAPGYGDDGDRSGEITCHAVDRHRHGDGALIWVSTAGRGTYWLDTATRAWSKAGDWALPFRGRAVPAPELGLWFGLSAADDSHICASDLAAAVHDDRPPAADQVWEGFSVPEGARDVKSYILHLNGGRFCVAKLYETRRRHTGYYDCSLKYEEETFALFTGVEVVRGDHTGKWHRLIKHRSLRYSLGRDFAVCVF